jgi:hypothetical protein
VRGTWPRRPAGGLALKVLKFCNSRLCALLLRRIREFCSSAQMHCVISSHCMCWRLLLSAIYDISDDSEVAGWRQHTYICAEQLSYRGVHRLYCEDRMISSIIIRVYSSIFKSGVFKLL